MEGLCLLVSEPTLTQLGNQVNNDKCMDHMAVLMTGLLSF